ncbi:rhomboid family intramembrane serine protease [Flavobacterium aciduliphilum]|uniref:Membrane associated rhomboid family serine protease n=1 Tax=Flavobacterium aciduliphilum TaxID=1101402 RepID=A0A328YZW8_9FLAO|nr:rhomboid family intramembrane serine protease [Flavobacterium aciduliphilum]RAR75566.1 membrane associated rhomboid family serine protease [Flavobacterium aciduliphilum]
MTILDDIKWQYKTGGMANKIIYWNVGAFLISIPLFFHFNEYVFDYPTWIALTSNWHQVLYFPYTLVTYSFLHAGFWHLFFNMMMLQFASRLFLTFFTQKQLVGLYILSGIFAGLCFVGVSYFMGIESNLVGASGAIMGVLVATTTYQPLMGVRLFLFGAVKLWHVTGVILLLFLLQIGVDNTGGHIAHFGGAFFGFFYIKLLQNGTDLSIWISKVMDFFVTLFQPKKKTPFKSVHVNYKKPNTTPKSSIILKDKQQQQVDEILDKISKSGYDSLTTEEKEFLFKSGK